MYVRSEDVRIEGGQDASLDPEVLKKKTRFSCNLHFIQSCPCIKDSLRPERLYPTVNKTSGTFLRLRCTSRLGSKDLNHKVATFCFLKRLTHKTYNIITYKCR